MDGRLGSSSFWAYPNFDPSIDLPGTPGAPAAQQSTVSTTDTFANWHGPMPHGPGTNAQDQASGGSSWPPRPLRPRSRSLAGSAAAPTSPSLFDTSPKWKAREAQVQANQEKLACRPLPPWSLLSQGSSDLLEAHKPPGEFTRTVPEKSLASTGGLSRFHPLRNDLLGGETQRKRGRAGETDAEHAAMKLCDTGGRDSAWRVNECKKRRDSSGGACDSFGLSTAVSGLSTVTPSTHCAGRTAAEPESELLFGEGLQSEGSRNTWASKRQRRVARCKPVEHAVGGFEKWADESLGGISSMSRLHSASSAERPEPAVAVFREHDVRSGFPPVAGEKDQGEAFSSLSQKESKMAREGCQQRAAGLPDSMGTPGDGLSSWKEVCSPGKQAPESILWRMEGREQRRLPSTEEEEEEQEEEESRVRKKPAGKRGVADVLEGLAADESACCAAAAGPERSAPHEKGLQLPRRSSFCDAPCAADSGALIAPASTSACSGGASRAASFPSLVMLGSAPTAAGSAEVDAREDCCLEARGASASTLLAGGVSSTCGQAGGAGTAAERLPSGCCSSGGGNWELWCPADGWTVEGDRKSLAQHQAHAQMQEDAGAARSMDPGSDDDDFPKFVLSSGRALSAPDRKQKPQTIDDEFEAYFSNLLL